MLYDEIFLFLLHLLVRFAVHLYRARLHDGFLYSEESTLFNRNLHLNLMFHLFAPCHGWIPMILEFFHQQFSNL